MYDLINAVEDNFISLPYIKNHIDLGWVRPSLLYQVKTKLLMQINYPMKLKI